MKGNPVSFPLPLFFSCGVKCGLCKGKKDGKMVVLEYQVVKIVLQILRKGRRFIFEVTFNSLHKNPPAILEGSGAKCFFSWKCSAHESSWNREKKHETKGKPSLDCNDLSKNITEIRQGKTLMHLLPKHFFLPNFAPLRLCWLCPIPCSSWCRCSCPYPCYYCSFQLEEISVDPKRS